MRKTGENTAAKGTETISNGEGEERGESKFQWTLWDISWVRWTNAEVVMG